MIIDDGIRMNPISVVKIRKSETSNILIEQSISIVKIYCNSKSNHNTWAKLLQFNSWQDVLDNYDTWGDILA